MRLIIIISIFNLVFCQDHVDLLITQVLEGSRDSAIIYLPSLEKKFPHSPKMLFLKGLMTTDGEKAKQIFIELYNNHPTSQYGDDAVMKVAEFYYASGLYIQSAKWLKKMPLYYSRSKHIERAIKLFLNSLIVSGKKDTAVFYSQVFQKQFPTIDIEGKINNLIKEYGDINSKPYGKKKRRDPSNKPLIQQKKVEVISKNYSLQSGAFTSKNNAEKQQVYFEKKGYNVHIAELAHKNKILFAVRIGYFSNMKTAKKVGAELQSSLGIETIIVTNE